MADGGDTHEDADSTLNSRVCDRRLSRAALRILRGHLEVGLRHQHHRQEGAGPPTAAGGAPPNLPDLLRAANLTFGNDCPLSADELMDPVEWGKPVAAYAPRRHAAQFALPPSLYRPGRRKRPSQQPRQNSPPFHQCALCQKTFVTRYYLDRHLDHNHQAQSGCAADWCPQFLSMQACHDAALEDEPHYGPGIGEHDPSSAASTRLRHYWFQRAHEVPCRDDDLRATKARCQIVVHQCLPPNGTLSIRLEQQMCGGLSCHHRLYRIFHRHSTGSGASWDVGVHKLWEAWNEHHQHRWGVVGLIVMALLALVYVPCATLHWVRHRRLRRRNASSPLPSRRNHSVRTSAARPLHPKKRL